jgi:hypothetical protein
MIPLTMLSAFASSGWKKLALGLAVVIVVAVLVGLAGWRGYRAGYESADLKRQAEVAAIHADHAQALAGAEAKARKFLEAATARAHALEGEYLAAKQVIANQSRELTNQRIAHASQDVDTADGTCRFGPEWVRLYNKAIGAGDGSDAMSVAPSGPAGDAQAASIVDAGLLSEAPTVTPEDILAHARDNGKRNRSLEAQLAALIQWAQGLNDGEVTP